MTPSVDPIQRLDILLVDDDESVADIVRFILPKREVHWISDGRSAFELLQGRDHLRDGPFLTLLDLKLPGVLGMTLLRELRADPTLKALPIVVLSGTVDEEEIAHCRRCGADLYIPKATDFQKFRGDLLAAGIRWAAPSV